MSEDQIADDIFKNLSEEDRLNVMAIDDRDDMGQFHHTTGRWIRNEYKLWDRPWTPDIKNGIDFSQDHPDAISTRIMEKVWDRVHAHE